MISGRWIAGIPAVITVGFAAAPARGIGSDQKLPPASARLAGLSGSQLIGDELRPTGASTGGNPDRRQRGIMFGGRRPGKRAHRLDPADSAHLHGEKPGRPHFLSTAWDERRAVDAAPYFGATEPDQHDCALENLRTLTAYRAMLVSLDGGAATNVYQFQYLAVSPQITATLPTDNILGVTALATTYVAAAWIAFIRPLPPGVHTILVELVHTDSTTDITQALVNVVPDAQ